MPRTRGSRCPHRVRIDFRRRTCRLLGRLARSAPAIARALGAKFR